MIGTRTELVICGNGIRDPGEQCDDGAQNGVDGCCDASCTFVDPNRVELCGGDGSFALTRVKLTQTGKVPDTSRILVKAALTGPGVDAIGGVTEFRVGYGGNETIVNAFTCMRKNTTLFCDGFNELWQLKLTTSKRGTKLAFKMKQALLPRPLLGPVTVSFVDGLGIRRAAALASCRASETALRCAP
jgi:cysteine-rich repeat protein